jgi:hypothetical protein
MMVAMAFEKDDSSHQQHLAEQKRITSKVQ